MAEIIISTKPSRARLPAQAAAPAPAPAPTAQPAPVPQVRHLVVDEAGEGQRLDNFLLRHLKGVPKTHVYRVNRSGEVRE